MIKSFWTVPVIGVYLYSIAILAQFGFNNFFGIPQTLIQSSLVVNVTFFWPVVLGILQALKESTSFLIVVVILSAATIFIYFKYNNLFRKTVWIVVTLLALLTLHVSYNFGAEIAAIQQKFHTLKQECSLLPNSEGIRYISPIGYETKAVFVSVNQNNELQPGYWLIDTTNTGCGLEVTSIGKVKN